MSANIQRFAGFLLAAALLSGACQTQKGVDAPNAFTVLYDDTPYRIDSPKQLHFFVEKVSGETELNIESAGLEELQDELGAYKAIRAAYDADGKKINLVAPLLTVDEKTALFSTECIMFCILDPECIDDQFVIYKRCGRLSCGCEEGAGGGSPVVKF